MKLAVAVAVLVFAALFVLTTFPQSPEAEKRAAEEQFTSEQIDLGRQLALQRRLILWSSTFVTLAFLLVLSCTSRARRLTDWFAERTGGRWWLTLLLMGLFCFVVQSILLFPLAVVSLEHWRAWGMTERSFLDWLIDYAKSMAITLGMGAMLLFGLFTLIRCFPKRWWIFAGGLAGLVAVCFVFILPLWIDPLFNTFTPLRDYAKLDKKTRADLEQRIRRLVDAAGVPVEEIMIVDASRQGKHTNAYFTGFGSSRQIVLYDTLVQSHKSDELETIIAHEIGHWQHRHIMIGLALGTAAAFVGFYLLRRVLLWAVDRQPFCLQSQADPAALPLILLLLFLCNWAVMPIENAISRHFERQADLASLQLAGKPDAFIAAERRLASDNKGNVAPSAFSVWFFGSHPPTVDRIRMAREWKKNTDK